MHTGAPDHNHWLGIITYGTLLATLLVALSTRLNKKLQLPLLIAASALLLIGTNFSVTLPDDVVKPDGRADFIALNQSQAIQQALDRSRLDVQNLKKQLDVMRTKLFKCKNADKTRSSMVAADTNAAVATTAVTTNRSPYCALVPNPVPSTVGMWNSMLNTIVQASKHDMDERYLLHDFTAQLLHLVSPDRLARSTMALPHDWTPVQRVMKTLHDRYLFLTSQGGREARKLKILVMGGSLIVGVNCRKIIPDLGLGIQMPNRLCTWTHRLESFLNKMLGGDYVEVHKIALGGTNTQTGFVLWDSNFLPDEAKDPDIVMNAYSTNDMHILTVLQAREGNQTLRDKVMEMTQDFVRSVLKDGPCAPLLMIMDDYLGNEQREILVTTELSQATMVLANYYGFSSMSYANVVRDIVYGDTHESWISPEGWYDNAKSDTMNREIHPGMGMHIITTWVAAFNMLHLAMTYCAIEPFFVNGTNTVANVDSKTQRPYEALSGLPRLDNKGKVVPGKPKGRPAGLPPPLVKSLSLENVTKVWKAAKPVGSVCHHASSHKSDTVERCPFSWFSGISKQGQNETYAQSLFSVTNPYMTENTGWDINTLGKKLGISPIPDRKQPLMTMEFKNMQLSTVTLFYMKSYGENWENSKIAVTVTLDGKEIARDELVGIHDKETSETYTHRIELPVSSSTTNAQVTLQHTGGLTFKIMGLAICK